MNRLKRSKHMSVMVLLAAGALAGCAMQPQRPADATDYDSELGFPKETLNLKFVAKQVYDDPLLGVALDYDYRGYRLDHINVYVYPVPMIEWDDPLKVCRREVERALDEIDRAVELGQYQSREGESIQEVTVSTPDFDYEGVRLKTEVSPNDGKNYHSLIYVFLRKDKFIKFRISIIKSEFTDNADGRYAVDEVLPELTIPGESGYMRALRRQKREELKEAQLQQLLQLLQEAAESAEGDEQKQ